MYPPFLQYASLNRSPESTAPSAQVWSGLGDSAGAGPCRRAACFDRHDPCFLWTVGVGANRRSYAFAFPICAFGPAKAAPPLWQPQLAVHDSKLDRLGARARAGTGVPRDDSDEPRRLNGWARRAGSGKRQQRQSGRGPSARSSGPWVLDASLRWQLQNSEWTGPSPEGPEIGADGGGELETGCVGIKHWQARALLGDSGSPERDFILADSDEAPG